MTTEKSPTIESLTAELAAVREDLAELRAHYNASQAQVVFLDAALAAQQLSMERLRRQVPKPK